MERGENVLQKCGAAAAVAAGVYLRVAEGCLLMELVALAVVSSAAII